MNRLAIVFVSCALAAGCKGKSDAEPPPLPATSAAPAAVAPAAAAPAPAAPAAAGSPTPEDYEQQAIDEINPQNMDSELDKLEKEIGQ